MRINPENVNRLQELCMNHVSSLDWAMGEGLQLAKESLQVDIQLPENSDGALAAQCNSAIVAYF
jgi:hypothetical protein